MSCRGTGSLKPTPVFSVGALHGFLTLHFVAQVTQRVRTLRSSKSLAPTVIQTKC